MSGGPRADRGPAGPGIEDLFDRVDRALAEEDTVPLGLAAEFLAALPRAEREAWFRTALDLMRREPCPGEDSGPAVGCRCRPSPGGGSAEPRR